MVEWVLTLLAIVVFVALYSWRSNWHSPMGRNILAFVAISGVEMLCLLLLGAGVTVWVWVFPIVFGALTITVWQRLYLLLQAQRAQRSADEAGRTGGRNDVPGQPERP